MKRRVQRNSAFKSKVVLEALKEHKTVSELACEYELHPTQISAWKKIAIEKMSLLFELQSSREKREREYMEREEELYKKIGQLQVEQDWLKKKLGVSA